MLILYDYFRSSACFRVRIALNFKGLEYQAIPIHLTNSGGEQFFENYEKINPQNLVPSLQDGTKQLTQSIAIIEYLDELHPYPSLLPKDPYEKALVRAFALAIAADIHPLNNLRVLNYLKKHFNLSDQQKSTWYHHWIDLGLSALEKQLLKYNQAREFCFGNKPSLADVCLIPQLYNARRYACDLTKVPNLLRIEANCRKLSAFTDAYPEALMKELSEQQ